MSKIKSVIAGLGIITALGVAIVPMSTYADEETVAGETTITANIYDGISMRLVSSDATGSRSITCNSLSSPNCSGEDQYVSTTILPGQADTTSMYTDIYVSTNNVSGYTLTLIDSDAINALSTSSGSTISAISSEPVGTTNPGWAIIIDGESSWRQVPISTGTAITVKTYQPSDVTIDDHSKVTYGVAATDTQDPGIYTDTIVYTATVLQ